MKRRRRIIIFRLGGRRNNYGQFTFTCWLFSQGGGWTDCGSNFCQCEQGGPFQSLFVLVFLSFLATFYHDIGVLAKLEKLTCLNYCMYEIKVRRSELF